MLNKMFFSAMTFAVLVAPLYANATESETESEATIDVVAEAEAGPDSLTGAIELPEQAADEAVQAAAFGLAVANAAREQGRDFGEERAREARESRPLGGDFDAEAAAGVSFRGESLRPAPAGQ